jgi:hypothetical protein
VKGQKNEILTRQESRHSSRPDVFYFLPTAHFLKQLPTHIAHYLFRTCFGIAKAPRANAKTKALSKSAILLTHNEGVENFYNNNPICNLKINKFDTLCQ